MHAHYWYRECVNRKSVGVLNPDKVTVTSEDDYVFSYSFIQQTLIPCSCIPFSDQHGEHACAANTETGGDSDGQIHHRPSGPRPSGSCELTQERAIRCASQTSLKGNKALLTHLERGRRKEYEVESFLSVRFNR